MRKGIWPVTTALLIGIIFGMLLHGSGNVDAQSSAVGNLSLLPVIHDSTLKGNGTNASPLGIANKSIKAPLLATNATPIAGQVLGFDGTNLAWQSPAASGGPLRVVDSQGTEIGTYENGSVIRYIAGLNKWFYLRIGTAGFVPSGISYIFASSDCTGDPQPYANFSDGYDFLVLVALTDGDTAYYPSGPSQAFTFNSRKLVDTNTCEQITETTEISPFATFSLSSVGGIPPFKVVR